VSDIAALARDTHKFESHYLDWLIGPYPQEDALYRERSPLFHTERLSRPVIFFQGDEDTVVPPTRLRRWLRRCATVGRQSAVSYSLVSSTASARPPTSNARSTLSFISTPWKYSGQA
jgi:hypothetical protein